jgi:DNA-damage-inducible protein J
MTKTAYINARVNKKVKADAQKVFREVGVNTSDAVDMFLRQVVMHQGIPFEVRIPNKETRAAIRELERGGGKRFDSVDALMEDALGKNWRSQYQKSKV